MRFMIEGTMTKRTWLALSLLLLSSTASTQEAPAPATPAEPAPAPAPEAAPAPAPEPAATPAPPAAPPAGPAPSVTATEPAPSGARAAAVWLSKRRTALAAFGGVDLPMGDLGDELDMGLAGRLAVSFGTFSPYARLELSGEVAREARAFDVERRGALLRVPVLLSAVGVAPLEGLPAPYVKLGGGVALASLSGGGSSTDAALQWGVGLRQPIPSVAEGLAVRLEGTHTVQMELRNGHFIGVLLGLEQELPFDADGDGRRDGDDQCVTTAEDEDGYLDDDGCPEPDNDGDTLLDNDDACPDEAEDRDGFGDDDGCPDKDNDGDRLLDEIDRCDDAAEDFDAFEDDDGCPDFDDDADKVNDDKDGCPREPEDMDGFQDLDGCPDGDNDGDGIADADDKCPLLAEDKNGIKDTDGCPDAKDDKDGDGLVDTADKCPKEPEDKDAFQDEDGCPDIDNDADKIADSGDGCPLEPEDVDGFLDDDGCPEEDNDGDGLTDSFDKCPSEAETINGVEDADGCPDQGAQLVKLTSTKIEIKETVQFETGSDVIRPESFGLLDQVAAVLKNHSTIKKLRIEGHTDDRGAEDFNLSLSEKRAMSVRRYLVDKGGVNVDRLDAVGYGEGRPLGSNKSDRGRALNRRVEFNIVQDDPAAKALPASSTPQGGLLPQPSTPPAGSPTPATKPDVKTPPAPPPVPPPAPEPEEAAPAQPPAEDPAFVPVKLKKARSLAAISKAVWGTEAHAQLLLDANSSAGSTSAELLVGTALRIPRQTTYTIQKGDTLGDVAKRLLGKTKYYALIIEASKATVPDATKLDVGMTVTIPLVHKDSEKKIGEL